MVNFVFSYKVLAHIIMLVHESLDCRTRDMSFNLFFNKHLEPFFFHSWGFPLPTLNCIIIQLATVIKIHLSCWNAWADDLLICLKRNPYCIIPLQRTGNFFASYLKKKEHRPPVESSLPSHVSIPFLRSPAPHVSVPVRRSPAPET